MLIVHSTIDWNLWLSTCSVVLRSFRSGYWFPFIWLLISFKAFKPRGPPQASLTTSPSSSWHLPTFRATFAERCLTTCSSSRSTSPGSTYATSRSTRARCASVQVAKRPWTPTGALAITTRITRIRIRSWNPMTILDSRTSTWVKSRLRSVATSEDVVVRCLGILTLSGGIGRFNFSLSSKFYLLFVIDIENVFYWFSPSDSFHFDCWTLGMSFSTVALCFESLTRVFFQVPSLNAC